MVFVYALKNNMNAEIYIGISKNVETKPQNIYIQRRIF